MIVQMGVDITKNSSIRKFIEDNKLLLPEQLKKLTDEKINSILKEYYKIIIAGGAPVEFKNDKMKVNPVNYIVINKIKSILPYFVTDIIYTLAAVYWLVKTGKLPVKVLSPDKATAQYFLKIADQNFLQFAFDKISTTVQPITNAVSSAANWYADKILLPVILVGGVVGYFLLKGYLPKGKN